MDTFWIFYFSILFADIALHIHEGIKIKQAEKENELLERANKRYKQDIKKIFLDVSEFISDVEVLNFDTSIAYLEYKKRPAYKEAKRIAELKKETKDYIKQYKLMRYEYDLLFSLFPELENYLEYFNEKSDKSIEDIKENYDYVKKWVDKTEYEKLSENDRNQLALERYITSRQKSKWAIGRDYEMFIAYEYEKKGYKVFYTGITEKLQDRGRDIIAKKNNETLIIQCKNWSQHKEIHENHICQLFGTTVQYNLENALNDKNKAIPVLITSTTLSKTALNFAKYLGVKVIQNKKFEEFPRIKCNINNNEKIYHLPFDQQYDRTIIGDREGEFFAWSVQEATQKGFRRAKKYFY